MGDESNTMDDPYYEFKRWCSIEFNILHRLKYVTNIIVKNLENKEYGGNVSLISIRIPQKIDQPKYDISSPLFTDYQKQTHCKYLTRKPDKFSVEEMSQENIKKTKEEEGKWCCCNG